MFVIQSIIHHSQQEKSTGMRLWCCTWAADSQLNLSMCAGVVIPGLGFDFYPGAPFCFPSVERNCK